MIFRSLKPLRHRLILLFIIALLVPSAFGIFAAIADYQNQIKRIWEAQGRYAALSSNYESNLFWESERLASSLAREENIIKAAKRGRANNSCANLLASAIKPYPAYSSADIFNLEGKLICQSYPETAPITISDQAWFQEILREKASAISTKLFSPSSKEPILSYGSAVYDEKNNIVGVVRLNIRLNWLAAIGQEPGLPSDSSFYLLDGKGAVMVGATPGDKSTDSALPDETYLEAIANRGLRNFETKGKDAIQRLYYVYAIREHGPYALIGRPWDVVIAPIVTKLLIQIGSLMAVALAGLLSALIGARFLVTRWTSELTRSAREISVGRLQHSPDMSLAPTEFRELGDTLWRMAEKINAREAELTESLAQKQIMLREIHHRVKNNLQIVTSLLNVYARTPRGEAVKQAFSDIQVRINTLALVHRHLYESQDLQEINLAPFMTNLCNLLYDGCGISGKRIRLFVDIPPVRIRGDRAVPLALLATEILTNSFKHAFPAKQTGMIRVKLHVDEQSNACLMIADDGIGYQIQENSDKIGGRMGQFLIGALARQLGGWIETIGPPGTTTRIYFNLEKVSVQSTEEAAPPDDSSIEIVERTQTA